MDVADDVAAVHEQRPLPRHPQGDVQDRTILGDVDPLAGEHRPGSLGHAGFAGELHQQGERLVGEAILRVVEPQPLGFGDQALTPVRVGGEEVAQMRLADLGVMTLQLSPRGEPPQP